MVEIFKLISYIYSYNNIYFVYTNLRLPFYNYFYYFIHFLFNFIYFLLLLYILIEFNSTKFNVNYFI